ncbi:hypothetical protein PROFUN_05025 [Planoprotostelium fungivorum]|uniref:Uncharacterized protein n=1 Tax=Planoprotostelium fungivorum TaxID=1890364 RepID=A0A2P6NSG1_9EUKA|nr:hypothetical protein PROFUN_05025 [Planoprotostelium fungivorum]
MATVQWTMTRMEGQAESKEAVIACWIQVPKTRKASDPNAKASDPNSKSSPALSLQRNTVSNMKRFFILLLALTFVEADAVVATYYASDCKTPMYATAAALDVCIPNAIVTGNSKSTGASKSTATQSFTYFDVNCTQQMRVESFTPMTCTSQNSVTTSIRGSFHVAPQQVKDSFDKVFLGQDCNGAPSYTKVYYGEVHNIPSCYTGSSGYLTETSMYYLSFQIFPGSDASVHTVSVMLVATLLSLVVF